MAAPIIIRVEMTDAELNGGIGRMVGAFNSAFDAIEARAKKAYQAFQQVSNSVGTGATNPFTKAEQAASAHSAKMAEIAAQKASRLAEVEAKSAARIAEVQARAAAQSAAFQEKLAAGAVRAAQRVSEGWMGFWRRQASVLREAGESFQQASYPINSLAQQLTNVGRKATQSAIEFDTLRTKMIALEGSAATADKKLAKLREVALATPGLTPQGAIGQYTQLKPIAGISQESIFKTITSQGKLAAAFSIEDTAGFLRNLIQIYTQSFERQDIKEAIGRVPIFNQLLAAAFPKSPDAASLRKLKESGELTLDQFLQGFAKGIESNPGIANIQESLASRFAKLSARVSAALVPLGTRILDIVEPAMRKLTNLLEGAADAFARLPVPLQKAAVFMGVFVAAAGPMLVVLGSLIQYAGSIGNLFAIYSAGAAQAAATAAAATGSTTGLVGGLAALKAGFVAALPTIALVAAAIAALVVAWKTDFAGIQGITAGFVDFVGERFEALKGYIESLKPTVAKATKDAGNEMHTNVQDASNAINLTLTNAGDIMKTTLRTNLSAMGDSLRVDLLLLTGQWSEAWDRAKEAQARTWEGMKNVAASGVVDVVGIIGGLVAALFGQDIEFFKAGASLGESVISGITSQLSLLSGAIPGLGLASSIFGASLSQKETGQREQRARDFNRLANSQANRYSSEANPEGKLARREAIDFENNAQYQILLDAQKNKKTAKTGGGSREAELKKVAADRIKLAEAEGQQELVSARSLTAALNAELDQRYREGRIALQEYLAERLKLIEATQKLEVDSLYEKRGRIEGELTKQKAGSSKALEKQIELTNLNSQISEKETERLATLTSSWREFKNTLQEKITPPDFSQTVEEVRATTAGVGELKASYESLISVHAADAMAAEFEALQAQLQQVDIQLATVGSNLGLKAVLEQRGAVLDLMRQEEQATLSMARNSVYLADQRIYHANRAQAIFVDHLAKQKSLTEAVADSMIGIYESVATSLEKGIDKLTKKLGIFGDVINGIIKSIVRQLLTKLFLPTFGGGGQGAGGGGGLFGNFLQQVFGGLLGGGGSGGGGGAFGPAAAGGLLTGGFAGGNPALQALLGGGGGSGAVFQGIPGGSNNTLNGVLGSVFNSNSPLGPAAGGGGAPNWLQAIFGNKVGTNPIAKGLGGLFAGGAISPLGAILGGVLGAGVGGQSGLGKVLGAIGGSAVGLGVSYGASVFGALGGGLGALGPAALAALGPIALIGAPLLLGAFLLSRAKQRGKDEEQSGVWLTESINAIRELKSLVATDQVQGAQAKNIFESQILAQFISQINTLKTKSVRESRLTNQVRDLRNLFTAEVGPEIEAQLKRKKAGTKNLIPEFASGGVIPGVDVGVDSVYIKARPKEMVLTQEHQRAIQRILGPSVWANIGVPGVLPTIQGTPVAAFGGVVPAPADSAGRGGVLTLDIDVQLSPSDTSKVVISGLMTSAGKQVVIKTVKEGRIFRDL